MAGPDHKASLNPAQLSEMINLVRQTEQAIGSKIKAPTKSEVANKVAARKSLVAAVDISPGTVFSEHNIDIKRPGNGMSPSLFWKIMGCNASRHYKAGQLINE